MIDFIRTYLPWLLSAVTICQMVMAGDKHPRAWTLAIGNQALWLIWILSAALWGLLPMNIALWIVSWRNHRKWSAS